MPTIYITGIIEDGTVRDESVPSTARSSLRISQGALTTLCLEVVRPSGQKVDLTTLTGLTLYFTMRRSSIALSGVPPDLQIAGVLVTGELGRANFTITANNTKDLDPGVYAYDVWAQWSSGREPLVPTSPLRLEPAVRLP